MKYIFGFWTLLKISTLYSVMIVLLLATLAGTINAQQANKPVTPTAVNPVVVALPVAATGNVNYVRTWDVMGPIADPDNVISAGYQDVKQTTQYNDGLGRPFQTVSRQITPQLKDIVAPVVYDGFGREALKYLPYVSMENNGLFKTDPFNAQKAFMQSQPQFSDEQVYYTQTEFEASPLNRVIKMMAPGNSWAGSGRGVSQAYLINTTNDAVRIWNINNNKLTYVQKDVTTNIPYNPATPANPLYNVGELNKKVVKEEMGNATIEYMDKEGQVVLKKVQVSNVASDYTGYTGFLCTYYIYDELNRLRFVMPPKAVTQLISNNWQFTNDVINELCFRYEYDDLGRLIAKKVPGADWVYMVYDVRDRLVFSQDGNMRNNNQWLATLYDALNRPVITGMMTGYSGNQAALQDLITLQKTTTGNIPSGMLADIVLPNAAQTGPFSGLYQAYNSITLDVGFESDVNIAFTAEIYDVYGGGMPEESLVEGITVNKNPIPSGATFIALTKSYYDNYSWTNKTYTASYNGLLDAGSNGHTVAMPSQAQTQTTGLITGTQIRVITDPNNLAAGNWLTTVNFYDNRNRVIQINSETHKGMDITTNLYDFTGKVLCSYLDHTNPTGTPVSVHVKTNIEYDHAGRLKEIWKTINDDNTKKALIARNEYDELGQLKLKELGHKKELTGNYTLLQYDPIEKLSYDYNIRGWMTGINKDYNNAVITDRWFGMELNYDKGFDINQYNGNIAGAKWRSKGDGERRAYGYTYDKASRLLGGDFTQYDGSGYADNAIINFDMQMGNGVDPKLAYDENGNILAMKQSGLKFNSSQVIDDLRYTYYDNSNKLRNVVDFNNDELTKLADFRTSANHPQKAQKASYVANQSSVNISSITDYTYDENGNLKKDLNKDLGTAANEAIVYNHLNLPWQIKVDDGNKGTITYVYNATGVKLQKITYEKGATVGSVTGDITTTTNYVGGLVYESKAYSNSNLSGLNYADRLQFIGHEEGRIRYIAATTTDPAKFEYDYFVKDHLGNVRMLLTEEQKQDVYPAATLEGNIGTSSDAVYKEKDYYNIIGSNIAERSEATGIPEYINKNGGQAELDPPVNNNPNSNSTALSLILYKLEATGAGGVTGLGITLKVMSGDRIDIFGKSYYFSNNTSGTNYNVPVIDVLTGLLGAPTGVTASKGATASGLNSIAGIYNGVNGFLSASDRNSGTTPKAFINWILLDDNFKYVSGSFDLVGAANTVKSHMLGNIPVTKNGYLYIYCSNESPVSVFFDNLQVIHTRGPLLEETHYYPFGLTMAGISSKALTSNYAENKYKYNGIEKEDGLGIEIYDAQLRELDPQIGRWWQIDPKVDNMEMWSPYTSNYDNPIRYSDPLGDEGDECCGGLKQWISERWEAQKRGVYLAGKGISNAVGQAMENAKDNWNAGNDPIHQAMMNPMSTLGGPVGAEAKAVGTIVNAEIKVGVTEVKVIENAVQKYEVGAYNELNSRSVVGDDLQLHHAPQTQPAKNLVGGYDKNTAPTIMLPTAEHQAIPTLKGTQTASSNGITTPQRAQLAKDIRDLRKNTNAPNTSLQKLINLTKKQFQGQFDKPPRINNK
jgi:RHS repeat-associated protein